MGEFGFPQPAGLRLFEADRVAAEGTRQAAISAAIAAGGNVAAAVKTAEIAFHRALLASGQQNGIQNGSRHALRELGATLT